ncbi:cellulose synthase complex periplasmic endoglucanase BcsZ [Undibacterium sp. Di26W]|uniref:cellulose synthase complex periplasmic endoglucanase BcsZ n=1 Tax=Undibacterium sp. Di26W TaxID=3413035 RepID=UPI003BF2BC5B
MPSSPIMMFKTLHGTSAYIYRLLLVSLGFCLLLCSRVHAASCNDPWPAWDSFKKTFIADDGRVIDHSGTRKPTTSEGQAYALFFALTANDRPAFQRILTWTENNLAAGDLTARLPAWQWGQREDNSWGIIDKNPASDADLWIAYALGLAGEQWKEPRFSALSSLLAQRILNEETADLPGLGLTLLPAPSGFNLPGNQWKLNASYLPLPLLRWFERKESDERWKRMLAPAIRLITGSAPKGYAADWIIYDSQKGFQPDAQGVEKGQGGYNAIRIYLWTGMMADKDSEKARLLKQLRPMANLVDSKAYPPEYINILTGDINGPGSSGFSAATLPFLQALGMQKTLVQQQLRLQAQPIKPDAYYDQVLSLFALGWQDKRFRFDAQGNVNFYWQHFCWRPF